MPDYIQFVVMRRKGRWSLRAADLDRVFADQHEAVRAGITLANESGKNGKPSVVLFLKTRNQIKTIWTYGIDPYPAPRSDLRPPKALPPKAFVTPISKTPKLKTPMPKIPMPKAPMPKTRAGGVPRSAARSRSV